MIQKLVLIVLLFSSIATYGQDEMSAEEKQKLAQIANNPMANAYKVFFQDVVNFSNRNSNTLYINALVPSSLGEKIRMVNRVLLPVDTRNPSDALKETALGNLQYQGIFTGQKPIKVGTNSEVVLGLGPSILFNTNTYENKIYGDDNWGVGFAFLGVYKNKGFMGLISASPSWGVGGDEVNTALIQYMLSYNFKSGFQIISSPLLLYNEAIPGDKKWLVPFGLGVGQLFKVGGKLPINLSVVGNYNAIRPDVLENNKWQLGINLMMILPSPKLMKAMKAKEKGEL